MIKRIALLSLTMVLALSLVGMPALALPGEGITIIGQDTIWGPEQATTYTITVKEVIGDKTINTESTVVLRGASAILEFAPSCGCSITDILVNRTSIGIVPTYTLSNINSNYEVIIKEEIISSLDNFVLGTDLYGGFSDVNEAEWYGTQRTGAVRDAVNLGIMAGNGDGTFAPKNGILLSEAIKMAAVVHNIYVGSVHEFTQGTPWYQTYVDYAIEHEIIEQDDFSDYTRMATRAEMAYIFANAVPANAQYGEDPMNEINRIEFADIPDIDGTGVYDSYILLLYRAGIVQGDSNGFRGNDNITRAEAAAIIIRIAQAAERIKK